MKILHKHPETHCSFLLYESGSQLLVLRSPSPYFFRDWGPRPPGLRLATPLPRPLATPLCCKVHVSATRACLSTPKGAGVTCGSLRLGKCPGETAESQHGHGLLSIVRACHKRRMRAVSHQHVRAPEPTASIADVGEHNLTPSALCTPSSLQAGLGLSFQCSS